MRGKALLAAIALTSAGASQAAVELACKQTGNERVESVVLRKDKTWTSAAGGWLTATKGKWVQKSTEGLVLRDEKSKELGMVKGLVFDKATKGVEYVLRFDAGGNTGSCLVTTTEL